VNRQNAGRTAGPTVAGIVLAAGRSSRMGRSKALLDAGGEPFIARAVTALRVGGCSPVIAVVPAAAEQEACAAEAAGAVVARNPDPGSEQADSLRLALRMLPGDVIGVLVLPVDHPLVRAASVAELIRAFAERRPPVVRPVLAGRPGHPTLFDRAVLDRGLAGPLPEGARSLVASLGGAVLDLPVEDPGIVADIDTPEEYRRHFGRAPSEYVQQTSDSGAARHERLAHERGAA